MAVKYTINNLFPDPNFKYNVAPGYKFNLARSAYSPATTAGYQGNAVNGGMEGVVSNGYSVWGMYYSFPKTNSTWFAGMNGGYFAVMVFTPTAATFQIGAYHTVGGALTYHYQSSLTAVPANTWTRLTTTAITIPAQNASSSWDTVNFFVNMNPSTTIPFFNTDCWFLDNNTAVTNPTAIVCPPYIDGDQPGCLWVTPTDKKNSASSKLVNNFISAKASSFSTGKATIFVPRNKPFTIKPGFSSTSGKLLLTNQPIPANSFDDFAVAPTGHPDPMMTLTPQGTVSTASDTAWTRVWSRFSAPRAYPIPGGLAWPNAAYASVGARFTGVANTKVHYIDLVQLEKGPKAAPLPWEQPRTINVTVTPNRINWVKNPSLEVDATGWTSNGSNSPVITRDTAQFKYGTASLKFTLAANPPAWTGVPYQSAAYILTGLTSGNSYTFSSYVLRNPGCPKVFVFPIGQTPGGITTISDYTGTWERISQTFTAAASTVTVGIGISQDEMTVGSSAVFWADGILCEENTGVGTYFDGSFGVDYLWEASGSPNNSRSFYYQGRRDKTFRLLEILKQNVPLGAPINIIYTQ